MDSGSRVARVSFLITLERMTLDDIENFLFNLSRPANIIFQCPNSWDFPARRQVNGLIRAAHKVRAIAALTEDLGS
jgi:hypothetical protein